jgi:TetR/AcrR family transcriptional regulator
MVKKIKDSSTEERILAAAQKVFINKGMAGARTQDIADEAGINKALLHYYFKSKEQLFETIFNRISQGFWQQITGTFESDLPLFTKIETFCSLYIDKIIENPYIPLFVLHEINQRPAGYVKKLFRGNPPNPGKFMEQVKQEIAAGIIRPIHPVHLLMNMLSMCVFPFVAKPMLMTVTNFSESEYRAFMEQRKNEIPKFIIESIKK